MNTYFPMDAVLERNDYHLPPYKFDPSNLRECIDHLAERHSILRRDANEKQKIHDQRCQRSYNKRKSKKDFTLYQKVLWNANARYSGSAKKLDPKQACSKLFLGNNSIFLFPDMSLTSSESQTCTLQSCYPPRHSERKMSELHT